MVRPFRRFIGTLPGGRSWLAGRNSLARAQTEINVSQGLPGSAGRVARKSVGVVRATVRADPPRLARDRVATYRSIDAGLLRARRNRQAKMKERK